MANSNREGNRPGCSPVTADDRPSWGQKWGQVRPDTSQLLAICQPTGYCTLPKSETVGLEVRTVGVVRSVSRGHWSAEGLVQPSVHGSPRTPDQVLLAKESTAASTAAW